MPKSKKKIWQNRPTRLKRKLLPLTDNKRAALVETSRGILSTRLSCHFIIQFNQIGKAFWKTHALPFSIIIALNSQVIQQLKSNFWINRVIRTFSTWQKPQIKKVIRVRNKIMNAKLLLCNATPIIQKSKIWSCN